MIMKKNITFVVMVVMVLAVLTSCSGNQPGSKNNAMPSLKTEELPLKTDIVQRSILSNTSTYTYKFVKLSSGKTFRKEFITITDTPSDFFFLEKGDTVYHNGKEIVKISFKN